MIILYLNQWNKSTNPPNSPTNSWVSPIQRSIQDNVVKTTETRKDVTKSNNHHQRETCPIEIFLCPSSPSSSIFQSEGEMDLLTWVWFPQAFCSFFLEWSSISPSSSLLPLSIHLSTTKMNREVRLYVLHQLQVRRFDLVPMFRSSTLPSCEECR